MGRILNMDDVEAAIRGGPVFAAGGGGWADHGRMLGTAAVNAGEPDRWLTSHVFHSAKKGGLIQMYA